MTGRDWKEHQCVERARNWEAILSSQGSLNESESRALAEVREFIANAKAPTDSFELVVADLLPDDDDPNEEPGAMCRRALAKAKKRVDLIRQVAILVSGADDAEDFERTYGHEDQASIRATAREIIKLVRATQAPDTITLGQTLALVRERLEGVLSAPHYAEEVLTLAIADIDRSIGAAGVSR